MKVLSVKRASDTQGGHGAIPSALAYMHAHCSRDLTLQETARAVYLSPTYFSRLFTLTTGTHFSDYLRQCRLERARELLESSTLLVREIAEAAGFRSSAYFIKLFSAAYGMTPGEYRRRRDITR